MNTKKLLSKIFNWMKDAGIKSLVILFVVTAGFYTYAAITWPGVDPNPVSGVVGTFVGVTDGLFDTDDFGYQAANDLCKTGTVDVPGESTIEQEANMLAHICTPDEIVNSYRYGVVGTSPIYEYPTQGGVPMAWISSGPPGFPASANDCKGWKVTTQGPSNDTNYGAVWVFGTKAGGLMPCRNDFKFACCK